MGLSVKLLSLSTRQCRRRRRSPQKKTL